jgi:hypothetical protein
MTPSDKTHHLISKHKYCFKRELSVARVEQVLQTWTKKINDHDIVLPLHSKPLQMRNTSWSLRLKDKWKSVKKQIKEPSLCIDTYFLLGEACIVLTHNEAGDALIWLIPDKTCDEGKVRLAILMKIRTLILHILHWIICNYNKNTLPFQYILHFPIALLRPVIQGSEDKFEINEDLIIDHRR